MSEIKAYMGNETLAMKSDFIPLYPFQIIILQSQISIFLWDFIPTQCCVVTDQHNIMHNDELKNSTMK